MAEVDPAIAHVLYWLFNSHGEMDKVFDDASAGDLRILKQAYFAVIAVDENMDYDGHTLSHIMDLDEDFIIEYVDELYKTQKHINRYDSSRDYSFIWKRDDFEQVIRRVSAWIYDHEKEDGTFSFTNLDNFFELKGNDQGNLDLMEKQDRLLLRFIVEMHEDTDFMEMVFGVITQFSPARRIPFVASFLKHNNDFRVFKEIPLEPYIHSWKDSAVPMLQDRLEYFESLLPLTNTVKLLQHKQYLEQEIQDIRSQIEHEKKRDFVKE